MTKETALKEFFSSFDIPAYPSTSVPEMKDYPYLTYEVITGALDSGPVALAVNLWYYATGESVPNAKARELSERIGYIGVVLPCDGGFIWLRRGSPWCQSVADDADPNIKRRYISVTAEYLTPD